METAAGLISRALAISEFDPKYAMALSFSMDGDVNRSCARPATTVYARSVNLGCMPTTLQDRLVAAMELAGKKPADLAIACHISRAAVSKWFQANSKNLKMEHLFAVADLCGVDARWLATGRGAPRRPKGIERAHDDIPQRRIDLIRMYGRLPDEVRGPIRTLIETLAYMHHPRKDELPQVRKTTAPV